MAEGDKYPDKRESLITLSEGTRVYLVPEFGFYSEEGRSFRTPTPSEFQRGINNFFAEIEGQGGQIITIPEKKVSHDRDIVQNGKLVVRSDNDRTMTFVVIKK